MTQGIYDPGRLTIPHYTSPSAGGSQGADPGVGNLLGHGERSLGRPRPILEAGTRARTLPLALITLPHLTFTLTHSHSHSHSHAPTLPP